MTETTLLTPVETPTPAKAGKVAVIIGWVLTLLIVAAMVMGGLTDILQTDMAKEGLERAGYPEGAMVPLGWTMVGVAAVLLIPQTAILGGLLITAYMGGAVATHVRMGDPLPMIIPAIVFASLTWIALLLRERRLRSLLPWRKV
ncbi:MAG: DoxX family protein [Tepidisphaeraceae bacterium]